MNEGNRDESTILKELVDEWDAMPSESEEEQKAADEFYWKKILPCSIRVFVGKEKQKLAGRYRGMILTVGQSPEPLIFSINAIEPERVLFLYTKETKKQLDVIYKYTGDIVPFSGVEKRLIGKPYALAIYDEVVDAWKRWGNPQNVAVDITGGTKSMTGGLAMVGALLSFQLLYVNNDNYCNVKRRPIPGSEYLELLQNPYEAYGCIQEMEANQLMSRQDYHGALLLFEELKEKAPDPRRYEILYHIASGYEAWDLLDFKTAGNNLTDAAAKARRYRGVSFLNEEELIVIEKHGRLLCELADLIPSGPGNTTLPLLQNKEAVIMLINVLYGNALRREKWGKWDTASLYLYRILEVMEQRRFAIHGVDTAKPDYDELYSSLGKQNFNGLPLNGPGLDDFQKRLIEAVNRERKTLDFFPTSELPTPISLFNGYILLNAINDRFSLKAYNEGRNKNNTISLSRLNQQLNNRNYSILAHGISFVTQRDYKIFKNMVEGLLQFFCDVEGIDNFSCERIALKLGNSHPEGVNNGRSVSETAIPEE
ncbi:MAG: TIGR02710 family CRISPR-associated protein [Firmicutes bacterium]|nr:TIGR02710 family CRISPR-associated protein [Bacillota bacterium]